MHPHGKLATGALGAVLLLGLGACATEPAYVVPSTPAERIAALARDLDLAAVQLHGDQPDPFITDLRAAGLPEGCAIWRAHRVVDDIGLPTHLADLQGAADRLLLDAYDAALPGGTGRAFDWQKVAAHPERGTLWLSGGIRPENVVRADALGCHGLDLSSGVERRPGDKDLDRLEALFALRRSGASLKETFEGDTERQAQ